MELGGAGWSWVALGGGGARFSNTHIILYLHHSKMTFNSYDPGGGSNVFIFIERVLAAFAEDDKLTMTACMLKTVEDIPKYKTREMRRIFQKQKNNLHSANIPKHLTVYVLHIKW